MASSDVVIVGAGFTGLTAAYELARRGHSVHVLEADDTPGGLAGVFRFDDGVEVEKFYHHWFNNDVHVPELVSALGLEGDILTLPSRNAMYYNNRIWRLSTPMDLLRFSALLLPDRIRLGLLVLRVRRIRDWRSIEHLSIREWLEPLCGPTVYRIVWEPLINAKFSVVAEDVNAVWRWKKLVLRGSTRNRSGAEELAYFKGGFGRLARELTSAIEAHGGRISFGCTVTGAETDRRKVIALNTTQGSVTGNTMLFTPAFPIIADILAGTADADWIARLRRIRYLGNICLVLRLNRSLSTSYWINVNDPGFHFVGVIEHTNFDPPEHYGGSHIAYLSRYLATDDPIWSMSDQAYFSLAMDHLRRMFPDLGDDTVVDYAIWRTPFAQPVTERGYSSHVPGTETPFENAWVATMAQIYPEDRGTNYAIREGRRIAEVIRKTGVGKASTL